jgi:uncharacterized membrane protein HdeD (DUF308 family)
MKNLSLSKKNTLINGVIFILLGLLFVAFPEGTLQGISLYVGLVILIPGIIMLVAGFMDKSGSGNKNVLIGEGVLTILFGLLFILKPGLVGILISVFIALWVILNGIFKLTASFTLKDLGISNWWVGLLIGLLLLVFGIYMLVNAFSVSVMITIWVGILLLAIGAYYLWDGFTGKFEDQD